MNKRWLLLALLLTLSGAHADTPPGKHYAPGRFDALSIGGSAHIVFTQGEHDELFIEGDDTVQQRVTVELRGSELVLRSEGSWRFWSSAQRLRLRVTMRDLRQLRISGAADFIASAPVQLPRLSIGISGAGLVRFERLQVGELRFSVSGSGDGHFSGSAQALSIAVSGRAEFSGEHLAAQSVSVSISGLGTARVWALETLDASISGIGTVEYWGAPQLNMRSSAISRFIDRGPKPAPPLAAPGSPTP